MFISLHVPSPVLTVSLAYIQLARFCASKMYCLSLFLVSLSLKINSCCIWTGRETTPIKDLKGWKRQRDDGKQFRQPQAGVHCYYASSGLVCLSAFCTDLKMVGYLSIPVLHWQEDHHSRAETVHRPFPRAWTTMPAGETTSLLSVSKRVGPINIPLIIFNTQNLSPSLITFWGMQARSLWAHFLS